MTGVKSDPEWTTICKFFEARNYVVAVVLLENVGPHNDTRFKHLRLASGQGIRRGGPSVRVQRGGGRSLLGSLRVQKGPLRVLAKILQSQCDGSE